MAVKSCLSKSVPNHLEFKVNGYTTMGCNSVIIILGSFLNRVQLLRERICSHRSKFFPLRVDAILETLCPGVLKNCIPLKTWRKVVEV